jgi:hypothetical protein
MVFLGLLFVGTEYSSTLSPIVYGILFYIIIGKEYSFNFVTLYKFLIILMIAELYFINLIDTDGNYLGNILQYEEGFKPYQRLGSKAGQLIGVDLFVPNTIFLGAQAGSMVSLIAIFMFVNNKIWKYISVAVFSISFSLTSILMLISGLVVKKIKYSIFYFLIGIAFFYFVFSGLTTNAIEFQWYYDTFSAYPKAWWERDITEKLFGYPKSKINTWSAELGYIHILKAVGLLNVLILILLNIILVFRRRNVHTIIVTMLHVSLVHYHPAIFLGMEQIFGLHIAYAMRNPPVRASVLSE